MALSRPNNISEVIFLIGEVQYYRDMWPRMEHILDPITEAYYGLKDRKTQNKKIESALK